MTSEEVETKELEILEDLNNDGTTGVDLSQEVFNPNASSPNNTHNNSTSRFAYTDENGGLILTRNAVNGLNLNSVGASDTGEIRHHGPDVARLSTPSGNSFTIPAGSELAATRIQTTQSSSGSLHADSFQVLLKDSTGVSSYTFSLDGEQLGAPTSLTTDEINKFNVQNLTDLENSGSTGTRIESEVFNPSSDGGTYNFANSQTRYLYSSSAGILISKNSLTVGSDLGNQASVYFKWNRGPDQVLVGNADLNLTTKNL